MRDVLRARLPDCRRVIVELPRFPELAHAQFSHGKLPYFESVRGHLLAGHEAGTANVSPR